MFYKKVFALPAPPQHTSSSFAWGAWDGTGHLLNRITQPLSTYFWPPLEGITIPPGPKGHFLFGNAMAFSSTNPFTFYNRIWADYHHLGPVINIPMFTQNNYLVTDPCIVKRVLQSPKCFSRASAFDTARLFIGNSVLTSEGPTHGQKRSELLTFLHQKQVPHYIDTMQHWAESLRVQWVENIKTPTSISISEDMMQLTLSIMCQTLLGCRDVSQSNALKGPLTYVLNFIATNVASPGFYFFGKHYFNVPTPANREFLRQTNILESEIKRILKENMANPTQEKTYLSQQTEKHGMDKAHPDPSKELIQDLLTVFIAGHETTAQALSFLFEELAFSQDIQSQLVAEINDRLGDRVPSQEDLEQMPFLAQVIETNLQRNPSVYMSARDVMINTQMTDTEGNHYHFEKGSLILISPYLIQRDPRNWPHDGFDPSLFEDSIKKGQPPSDSCDDFRIATFFGGNHRCLGRFFARQEMKLILIELLRHVHLTPLGPRSQKEMAGPLRPKSPIRLNLSLREEALGLSTKKTR